jgi:hypothetical protein
MDLGGGCVGGIVGTACRVRSVYSRFVRGGIYRTGLSSLRSDGQLYSRSTSPAPRLRNASALPSTRGYAMAATRPATRRKRVSRRMLKVAPSDLCRCVGSMSLEVILR